MVAAALSDFGAIDILVNNAGIASRGHSVVNTDPAEFERVWRVHTFGSFSLAKLVLKSSPARRSMVWPISVITLASWLEALYGDRYVKAEPAIDSLLERYPTGSKAPPERSQLPACRH